MYISSIKADKLALIPADCDWTWGIISLYHNGLLIKHADGSTDTWSGWAKHNKLSVEPWVVCPNLVDNFTNGSDDPVDSPVDLAIT